MTLSSGSHPAADYSLGRSLRLTTFQIGSAMGEILTASVWNRVMITDLGMLATPVGFLLALQYFLIPISLWAGHRSDTIPLWGRRRTSYIWLGRGLMLLTFPLLGLSVREFESGQNTLGWMLATAAFILFGVGKLMSGSVYLALVRESAPPAKQGLAISLTETVLIVLFPIAAIGFGRWMEVYDRTTFWQMIVGTVLAGAFFWWFAIARVEKQATPLPSRVAPPGVSETLRRIWQDRRTRQFFLFLAVATFAAWMQDNILEPFGGDVFGLPAGRTTRFTGYWGGATVLVLVICFIVWRRRPPEQQRGVTGVGLFTMALGMLLLAVAGWTHQVHLISLCLLVYGSGFGLYTFGGLSLMAVMSPDRDSGAYLGLWTIAILLFKGAGTFFGGAIRDILYPLSPALAYGIVFVVAALGLLIAVNLLRGIDILAFARESKRGQA